ncbi:class I SAM-dependent methyltransferase [Petrocella sp. FN5]|uniref:class I SAM-dependent methyltransferase n=1 Tax=Petrocella sp. FN5 TaxID=3032002 RepID=UPI0023DA5B14|nr:class I SAM-dependent methyltransferase [Petrocella sp. FN5]MDF1617742.1 class I SAM-dependent methyltransferase [Petrocella sp. FN5]
MSYYKNIIHFYDQLFPLDQDKLDFVNTDSYSAQKILDIGCATGALCHALYHLGHEVVGIDIDKKIIDQARGLHDDGPTFHSLDMLDLKQHFEVAAFDQILCFDNTLAHLPNEMAVRQFFKEMSSVLKDKGVFKCEVVNYDLVLAKGILELPVIQVDDLILKRHQCLEQQCMECYTELIHDGEVEKNCIPLFPVRYEQLQFLLKEAGFTKIEHYRDFKRNKPEGDHIYNIIEARK